MSSRIAVLRIFFINWSVCQSLSIIRVKITFIYLDKKILSQKNIVKKILRVRNKIQKRANLILIDFFI